MMEATLVKGLPVGLGAFGSSVAGCWHISDFHGGTLR